MTRFQAARCNCGCGEWLVIDTRLHIPLEHCDDMWLAQGLAEALNEHRHTPPGDRITCPDAACGGLVAVLR